MLKTHAKHAMDCGMKKENIFVLENGKVLQINEDGAKVLSKKVPAKDVLIDGNNIGGVNTQIIEERKELSMRGMISIIVTLNKFGRTLVKPTIISKGFLFAKDNEQIFTSIEKETELYFKNNPLQENESLSSKRDKAIEYLQEAIKRIAKQNPIIFLVLNKTEMERETVV